MALFPALTRQARASGVRGQLMLFFYLALRIAARQPTAVRNCFGRLPLRHDFAALGRCAPSGLSGSSRALTLASWTDAHED